MLLQNVILGQYIFLIQFDELNMEPFQIIEHLKVCFYQRMQKQYIMMIYL